MLVYWGWAFFLRFLFFKVSVFCRFVSFAFVAFALLVFAFAVICLFVFFVFLFLLLLLLLLSVLVGCSRGQALGRPPQPPFTAPTT